MPDQANNSDSALRTPHSRLSEALAFYGMGELADAVTRVSVAAVIDRVTDDAVICDVMSPSLTGEPMKRCEFVRSQVIVNLYNANAAVVLIPKAYLPAFCLWKYELTGKLLATFEARVARHNAPYLKSTSAKPERIGNVRI